MGELDDEHTGYAFCIIGADQYCIIKCRIIEPLIISHYHILIRSFWHLDYMALCPRRPGLTIGFLASFIKGHWYAPVRPGRG